MMHFAAGSGRARVDRLLNPFDRGRRLLVRSGLKSDIEITFLTTVDAPN